MGTAYTDLAFTNTSGSTCSIVGYPGVSFLGAAGGQLGDPAVRVPGATPVVAVAPGASAHATLIDRHPILDQCQGLQATPTSIRIFVPNETAPIALPWQEPVCTVHTASPQFEIAAVKATSGVGG